MEMRNCHPTGDHPQGEKLEIGNNETGSILLLALLIMSVIMVGSVALSSLVLSGIRQANIIDNAMVAYYAAESGVEESLYRLRKAEENAQALANESRVLQNGARFEIGAYGNAGETGVGMSDAEEDITISLLPKEGFTQLDLFYAQGSTDVRSLRVEANGDGTEWLEASWFGWSDGELTSFQTKLFSHNTITDEGGALIPLSEIIGVQDAYRVKLRALYSNLNDVKIRAFDASGEQVQIPSRIIATIRGIYRGTAQTLSYAMPRTSPLGGLFDFVLFSECSIVKGVAGECE